MEHYEGIRANMKWVSMVLKVLIGPRSIIQYPLSTLIDTRVGQRYLYNNGANSGVKGFWQQG